MLAKSSGSIILPRNISYSLLSTKRSQEYFMIQSKSYPEDTCDWMHGPGRLSSRADMVGIVLNDG